MFEHEQEIVNSLLLEDNNFKRLYDKHGELKQRVKDANLGTMPIDDIALENIKKEKLLLKDQMAHIIQNYQRAHQ